ncbi:hypothetical protein JDV02_008817 [Purpureocillium takamizusanense]|uniref:Glutamine amidotransferase domain-containing protein n=1 Tax=Purpureocillium takamizusanense TaxID=2060973 RepID=A0A9Q8QNI1_9HYPO|nr:uncharacterized protein JDV02_008817 [Purpureocillium takamizusanense]UNI22975.1 hypothetical protein JDV02_008817 [Purpureocillium takamizusanense]
MSATENPRRLYCQRDHGGFFLLVCAVEVCGGWHCPLNLTRPWDDDGLGRLTERALSSARALSRPIASHRIASHRTAVITTTNNMKALVLKTFPAEATGPVGDAMASAFRAHLLRLEPDCQVDVCGLADDEPVPDPLSYDLVIFSGGIFDLLSPEPHPAWVARAKEVVRAVAADDGGQAGRRTKLLGICFGHQIIHLTLGGQLAVLAEGPRIGIEQLQLTPEGARFFGKDSLRLHKFHKRQVKTPAEGFVALAPDNEILCSASGRLLSFQAHPELSADISHGLLDSDKKGFYKEKARSNPNVVLRDVHSEHDGAYVWSKIVDWVRS